MGMDIKVRSKSIPSWESWTVLLTSRNALVQMRMIDNMPAFPDETPPEDWRDVRVNILGNMITLRRETDGVRLVTWGNTEGEAVRAWRLAAWAIARASDGMIQIDGLEQTAEEFEAGYLSSQ